MLVCSTAHTFHYKWFVQLVRSSFQPKIGFKTRYGIAANPFHTGTVAASKMVQSTSLEIPTSITEKLKLLTLCNFFTYQPKERGFVPLFFFFINTNMTTETSPLNRQPDKLDYSSPTQFRFILNQIPKVQFFVQTANIPGISLGEAVIPTPYKDIPYVGDKVTYESLNVQFLVDEHLENYIEMHNWMIGLGFPKTRQQFTNFRSTTSKYIKCSW